MGRAPNVLTIPPAAPFLPALVAALVDGRLVPGNDYRADPLALADVTIFLPTRRAARALSGALAKALGGGTVVLPRIRPLGDVEDDPVDAIADPADLDLPPAIPPADRLVGLARLILDWRRFVTTDRLLSPSGQPIAVPTSAADALHLAADLLGLMDQAAAEGVDWSRLNQLVPDDYAAWWQMTLTFLEIATGAWPRHLRERGLADPVDRRTRLTLAIAERLERVGSRGPVIAAGSTGSVPATARLLKAIAHLPQGAVVLPGLDLALDDATFADLTPDGGPGVPSHPQAAMARLLATIGTTRADVRLLAGPSPPAARRAWIVSEAMRPAESTDRWPSVVAALDADPDGSAEALDGIALVAAANEAEEALAVALALRETLETPGATAALVTPDRGLARRVCAELKRFGVAAEDSAGQPLARSRTGVLALLLAEAVVDGLPPDGVVALAKHPLAAFGMARPRTRAGARALELAVLRGPRLAAGSRALVDAADRLCRAGRRGHDVHPAAAALGADACDDARALAAAIRDAVEPLEALVEAGEADLKAWLAAAVEALRRVVRDETGSDARLFDGPAGAVFADLVAGHLDADGGPLPIAARDLPATLRALMAGATVRRPVPASRISIWGPLEARLMTVDRLVVGGLNEGVWPLATDTGPWLSRPMRAGLAFSPPEVRIGLSAHDFAQSLGCRDVVLTRSTKREGAPTVATRFLQRLTTLVGARRTEVLQARGERFLACARALDDGPPVRRAPRPEPTPPLDARPDSLSVTEIETWIRDPYAIYARRILALEPLADLGERPDFGTRGTALHKALSDFAKDWTGPWDDTAVARLVEIGRAIFDAEFGAYPEIHALWWPRFAAAAGWVVREFEARQGGVERVPEVKGALDVPAGERPFRLRGRADRIDILPDGRASVVDFKTGSAPSPKQIATVVSPQLPLEAAILRRGGFDTLPAMHAAELVHVVLRGIAGRDEVQRYTGHSGKDFTRTLDETVDEAERRLVGLATAYADPAKGYLSRAHPFRRNDRGAYDHLARVMEWSIGSDDEGGEE